MSRSGVELTETARTVTASVEEYLSEQTFCARYGVAPRTAQRWRLNGDGPNFVRFGKRIVRYRLRDVEAWAVTRTYPHRAAELARSAT